MTWAEVVCMHVCVCLGMCNTNVSAGYNRQVITRRAYSFFFVCCVSSGCLCVCVYVCAVGGLFVCAVVVVFLSALNQLRLSSSEWNALCCAWAFWLIWFAFCMLWPPANWIWVSVVLWTFAAICKIHSDNSDCSPRCQLKWRLRFAWTISRYSRCRCSH